MAASNSTAGAVLRRLALGGSAAVLAALLFGAQPAAASSAGHGNSAQAVAHQHQSDQDQQAAKRAAKQAAERAKQAAERAKRLEQAKRAQSAHAKAERAAAQQQVELTAAAERQASQAAGKAQVAADQAQAVADKARAAATKALRKASLPNGSGNNGNGNYGNGSAGDQPATPGKNGVPTGRKQPVATPSVGKASSTELASTATRQAAAVGSVFVTDNSATSSSQPLPAGKPVQRLVAVKHPQPRTQLAAPPLKVLQVQTPIQLAEAGLSLGAGPLVLLGLVVIGGLATVTAGTRRRSPAKHAG